mgnify:CR=1 FL=1
MVTRKIGALVKKKCMKIGVLQELQELFLKIQKFHLMQNTISMDI